MIRTWVGNKSSHRVYYRAFRSYRDMLLWTKRGLVLIDCKTYNALAKI